MKRGFLFILLILPLAGSAQTEWNLKIDKPGLKVFNHNSDTGKFRMIRVEAFYKASLSDLVGVLFDVPHHKDWSYGSKYGYVIKKISPSEILFYKEISTPPPLSNRDFVGTLSVRQDPATKIMTVDVTAKPGLLPVKNGLVRVRITEEKWLVTPLPNGTIKIDYFLKVDPGGSVSPFLVNMFATKGPYETFKSLNDLLLSKSSTPVSYPFIKD